MRGKSIEITQFEQQFIRDNCASLTDDIILERLNVLRHRSQKPLLSKAQVTKKRQRMGIAKKGRGKLVNIRALASDLKFRGEYPPKQAEVQIIRRSGGCISG